MSAKDWKQILCSYFRLNKLLRLDRIKGLPVRGKGRETFLLKMLFDPVKLDFQDSGELHDVVINAEDLRIRVEFKEQRDVQWLDPSKYVRQLYKYRQGQMGKEEEVILVFGCKDSENRLDLVFAIREKVLLDELFDNDTYLEEVAMQVADLKQKLTCKRQNTKSKICYLQLKVPVRIREIYEKFKDSEDLITLFPKSC